MMTDHSISTARFARRRLAGAVAFTITGLVVCFWVLVGKPEAESSQQVEPRRPLVDVMIATPAEHAICGADSRHGGAGDSSQFAGAGQR